MGRGMGRDRLPDPDSRDHREGRATQVGRRRVGQVFALSEDYRLAFLDRIGCICQLKENWSNVQLELPRNTVFRRPLVLSLILIG